VNFIFDYLKKEIGPIPGKYVTTNNNNIFQTFFLPKLRAFLTANQLKTDLRGSVKACFNTTNCQTILMDAVVFIFNFKDMYPGAIPK
jgi:hypothetical protein